MARKLFPRFRRAFLAGILVVVPLAFTVWVLVSLGDVLESGIHLVPRELQPTNPLARSAMGILLALGLVMAVGLATRSYLGNQVVLFYEAMLARVPILSTLYGGVKQLLEALFSSKKRYFREAVLVEWPQPGYYCLAFCTGEAFLQKEGEPKLVNLFMPTTPNITTGFFIVLREDRVISTDMTVEEAFKLLMSAGIVAPEWGLMLTPDGLERVQRHIQEEVAEHADLDRG